jgi:glycosyltransferase involved in cell wall biosynthesis
MKVAFDHQIFAIQRVGGVSRYFAELLRRLPGHGVDARLVATAHINSYLACPDLAPRVGGLFIERRFRGAGLLCRWMNALLNPLSWHRQNADVVHETYYSPTPVGKARQRVLTVYDMIHERFPDCYPRTDPTSAHKRLAVARADHVLCISRSTQKDLIELFGVEQEKTSVVHLGHELPPATRRAPDHAIAPYILYVGQRGRYKNFGPLLEAFAASAQLKAALRLVAFGGGSFTQEERSMLSDLHLTDLVEQESGDDAALARRYAGARAFVFPSLYEGFGLPPLEAMALDCPVACSNSSSIPEVVGEAACLFDPASVDAIREAIERVSFDESYRRALISAGRERLTLFSWDRCAAETARAYSRLG